MNSILPLILNNISYSVGEKKILKEISTTINSGLPKIILGSNGAGKTILMKICHGLIQPTSGSVNWSKKENGYSEKKHTMVFQRPIMLRRSVLKNLIFVLKSKGYSKYYQYELINTALKLVNMEKFKGFSARCLSQGEQQKLALARAWLLKPEVLFLDEPTANLDPKATESVENIVREISNCGTQVIMSTHNLAQAKRIGDEILFIHEGELKETTLSCDFFSGPKTKEASLFIEKEKIK